MRVFTIIIFCCAVSLSAQFQTRLVPPDGEKNAFFGLSVAIDGSWAVVSAINDDDGATNAGAVYVYHKEGFFWLYKQTLLSTQPTNQDDFGHSVDISGDFIVIGDRFDDDRGVNSGSAYIFRYEDFGWVLEAKLLASDGVDYDRFGAHVAISGKRVVIGAPLDDDAGTSSGSAYVFEKRKGSWIESAKLTAEDANQGDEFGRDVDIWQDHVIVGAPLNDDNGTASGCAYIFCEKNSNWEQSDKLLPQDNAAYDYAGDEVSIYKNWAVISSMYDDDRGSASGSVALFKQTNHQWEQHSKLVPSDINFADFFGRSVSLNDNYMVVGSMRNDEAVANGGSAYLFKASLKSHSSWYNNIPSGDII